MDVEDAEEEKDETQVGDGVESSDVVDRLSLAPWSISSILYNLDLKKVDVELDDDDDCEGVSIILDDGLQSMLSELSLLIINMMMMMMSIQRSFLIASVLSQPKKK